MTPAICIEPEGDDAGVLEVVDFLPAGFVRDASVSYQKQIQQAIDEAAEQRAVLEFAPIVYLLDDPAGLKLRSYSRLRMNGAVFVLAESCDRDGYAFHGVDVQHVQLRGATVRGQRQKWPDSVNIAGVRIEGRSAHLEFADLTFEKLSSHPIGLVGTDKTPITDVVMREVRTDDCCNEYVDYLQPHAGPAKGSSRLDQGNVAFYYVQDFVVRNCVFKGSRSDGTHFFECSDGQFINNHVIDNRMGGYFLETCRDVIASGNIIRNNGSRGVTIERDSVDCTLVNNVITGSGREGLWAPDVERILVANNIFRHNGRKNDDNGGGRDCEIRIDEHSTTPRAPWTTITRDIRIANNIITTTEHQGAAVFVSAGCLRVAIESNTFTGEVRLLNVPADDTSGHLIHDNIGLAP